MKKILVSLMAIIASVTTAFAMSPQEAYKALTNIPNVSYVTPDYNLPIDTDSDLLQSIEMAGAYNLNAQQIQETGNAAFTILNQVPLTYMKNGGSNGEVAMFVYTKPTANNENEMLMAIMSGYKGSVVFLYGTVSDEYVNALQAGKLQMEGNFLSFESPLPNGYQINVTLSKAR